MCLEVENASMLSVADLTFDALHAPRHVGLDSPERYEARITCTSYLPSLLYYCFEGVLMTELTFAAERL